MFILVRSADCNDKSAYFLASVTGCAAQNLYAPDHSDVCLSAAHAGLVTSAGGTFEVEITDAGVDYQGCTANGVCSSALVVS